jgi:limonene-1,2-epoxide hydrolase
VGIEREEAVRSFLLEFSGEHLDSARVERLLGYMAADARYHVFAWWEPCVGHDAIREELLRQGTMASDTSFELLNFASAEQTVFVQRLDWFTMNNKHVCLHVVGAFGFDDNGKITSWRDYFDTAELTAKVGRIKGIGASQEGGDQ